MSRTAPDTSTTALVLTIGHSNRPLAEFIDLLGRNAIEHIIDVRTVPRSRHNPQYGQDLLPGSLRSASIDYTHLPGLGGLRKPRPDSLNIGWRNLSFRGYADYMETQAFSDNLDLVAGHAVTQRCALMCAEAVPWRCHRSLIADALLVRDFRVEDVIGPGARRVHLLTSFAQVDGLRIRYGAPSETTPQSTLFGPQK